MESPVCVCVSSPNLIEFSVGLLCCTFRSLPSILCCCVVVHICTLISIQLACDNPTRRIHKVPTTEEKRKPVGLNSPPPPSTSLLVCLLFFLSSFLSSFLLFLVLPLRYTLFIPLLSIVHPTPNCFSPLTYYTHQPVVCLLFVLSLVFLLLLHKTTTSQRNKTTSNFFLQPR